VLVALGLLAPQSWADVPHRMHYQGFLTDASGQPANCANEALCPPQSFEITFRLYDTAEGGDPVWVEQHEDVAVTSGRFNVELGSVAPLSPDHLGDPSWLGLEINGGGEMAPRQRLVSSAFALRADQASQADVASLSDDADRLGGTLAQDYALLSDLPGLCVTDDELDAVLAEASYLDEEDVSAYLTESGYIPGPHFSGEWADLAGVPQELLDGDDDTLAFLSC
jgi:hypothetical protein